MESENKRDPLVTIAVPMFNVEPFLRQCLDSVVKQTYKNLEIIVVNDGSPDRSGKIAGEYAESDGRFRVIHQENKGVSAARNSALRSASGEYIAFVDADDFLASDFVQYMIGLALDYDAEFIFSRYCQYFPVKVNAGSEREDNVRTYTSEEAAADFLYPGRIEIGCWNKLFNRKFLLDKDISFPEDLYMGEGLNFIVSAALNAKRIVGGTKKVYYYRKNNQQSATTSLKVEKYLNALSALERIEQKIGRGSNLVVKSLRLHRVMTTYSLLRTMVLTKSICRFKKEYREKFKFLRSELFEFVRSDIRASYKFLIAATCFSPRFSTGVHEGLRYLRCIIFKGPKS